VWVAGGGGALALYDAAGGGGGGALADKAVAWAAPRALPQLGHVVLSAATTV